MDIEAIQQICMSFPQAEEGIKWKSDLVFMVGKKMFCIVDLATVPTAVSFKVPAELYEEISNSSGFRPAPWFAQHKWVMVDDISDLSKRDWEHYLKQSYDLVVERLSRRLRRESGL